MDITIEPDLSVSLCRWQRNRIQLGEMLGDRKRLADVLAGLMHRDHHSCPYGISAHQLSRQTPDLSAFVFSEHGEWPPDLPEARSNVLDVANRREFSYQGRSGSVAAFERTFAAYHKVDYCLAVASGTAALYLAYAALDLRDGAEVILPIYSYPGTWTPLRLLNARVLFCDVDPNTGNIALDSLERIITSRTRAVVVTHMWGDPADMQGILDICGPRGIEVVEDCSHAFGANLVGRAVGSFGAVGCFSLQANKPVCAGEGGMLLTNRREIFERATLMSALKERVLGSVRDPSLRRYWETGLGLKLKIHPMAAALGLGFLQGVAALLAMREERARAFAEALGDARAIYPPRVPSSGTTRSYYTIKPTLAAQCTGYRDRVVDFLIRNGLQARTSDLRPLCLTALYAQDRAEAIRRGDLQIPEGGSAGPSWSRFPGAELYFARIFSIPAFTFEPLALARHYGQMCRQIADLIGDRGAEVLRPAASNG